MRLPVPRLTKAFFSSRWKRRKCFLKAWNDCYGVLLEDGGEGGDDEPAREAGVLGDVDVGDAVEAEIVAPLGELVPRGAEGAARGTPGREADKKNASF